MRKLFAFFSFIFFSALVLNAQSSISLEDLWKTYRFYSAGVQGFTSMKDGLHYTINNNGTSIEEYAYENGEKVADIFTIQMTGGVISNFDDYAFNDDESAILLKTDVEGRYRWATFDNNYIYDRTKKTITKLSEKGKQMYADFAAEGNKIAYMIDNNLYYKDLNTNTETQITTDGALNHIINGGSDWVYEEEFTLIRSFEWSPDGGKIAYYKFDESEVPQYDLTLYGNQMYPEIYQYKYPKVGEKNSKVQIYIYDLATKKTIQAETGSPEYIPRIKWINNNQLCITTLNRLQNDLNLLSADASTGKTTLLLNETSSTYLEMKDDLTFINNKGFIWSSERDGFNHLYLYNMNGKLMNQITTGNWEVTEFKGYDAQTDNVYYMSTESSPLERNLYCIKLNGKNKQRLTQDLGTNSVEFSNGFKYYINNNTRYDSPDKSTLYSAKGKEIRVLESNEALRKDIATLDIGEHSFFSFTTTDNVSLNGYMIKPKNFDPNKKYPVFMFVYGGPGSQNVIDAYEWDNFGWFNMLAQHGYIVACVDNRGTGGRGRDFRTTTYEQLGRYETDDQIEAAKWLSKQSYVDGSRIGIFGWSYGGYMAALCITRGADVFKCAISVAPVTNWKYYDNVYTERYMGTMETNPNGFDENAPINFASKLKGKYLLVHGTGDDNVHFQNSAEWIEALIKNNKQFDLMIYPDKNHGIYGGNTRLHLFTLMTNFIYENL